MVRKESWEAKLKVCFLCFFLLANGRPRLMREAEADMGGRRRGGRPMREAEDEAGGRCRGGRPTREPGDLALWVWLHVTIAGSQSIREEKESKREQSREVEERKGGGGKRAGEGSMKVCFCASFFSREGDRGRGGKPRPTHEAEADTGVDGGSRGVRSRSYPRRSRPWRRDVRSWSESREEGRTELKQRSWS